MYKSVRWLWIIGLFGLVGAANANAQTPSPSPPVTKFDGTYAFVSSTKVNDLSTDFNGRMKPCRDLPTVGLLSIANGQARLAGYTHLTAAGLEGTVGPQGELRMHLRPPIPTRSFGGTGRVRDIIGRIDGAGTVNARQVSFRCQYDLIWLKCRSKGS